MLEPVQVRLVVGRQWRKGKAGVGDCPGKAGAGGGAGAPVGGQGGKGEGKGREHVKHFRRRHGKRVKQAATFGHEPVNPGPFGTGVVCALAVP